MENTAFKIGPILQVLGYDIAKHNAQPINGYWEGERMYFSI